MGKYAENEEEKEKCLYAKILSCECSLCERKRGCFNCLECKKNGERKPITCCDMQIC